MWTTYYIHKLKQRIEIKKIPPSGVKVLVNITVTGKHSQKTGRIDTLYVNAYLLTEEIATLRLMYKDDMLTNNLFKSKMGTGNLRTESSFNNPFYFPFTYHT